MSLSVYQFLARRCPIQRRTPASFFLALAAVALTAPASARADPPPPELRALQQSFERLAEELAPSVVAIRARRYELRSFSPDQALPDSAPGHTALNGSGVVIAADGLILTNHHVIQNAHHVEVITHDGRRFRGSLVAEDARRDVAVLRIRAGNLPPVKYADWDTVRRGQWSIAIGNPYGLGADGQLSVSVGIVSNLDRALPGLGEVDDRLYADMIQTTAQVHPGNSGGPLFNLDGELIGLITALHTRAIDEAGVGFAVPMSPMTRRIIDTLAVGGSVEYGYLGVTIAPQSGAEGQRSASRSHGVLVEEVEPDGPAQRSGVAPGDLLLEVNGRPVRRPSDFAALVGQMPAGEEVTLLVQRDDDFIRMQSTLGTREPAPLAWLRGQAIRWRGMRLAEVDPRRQPDAEEADDLAGLVITDLLEGAPASRAGLNIGDVIVSAAGRPVQGTRDLLHAIALQKGPVEIVVRDRGAIRIEP